MSLKTYNQKRNFKNTPEPQAKPTRQHKGKKKRVQKELRFVVQMHAASRLHFDLRLEMDGAYKSWAVPKGPSLNPLDQRLAVFVEDHPLEYGSFEGIIPKGNYGAGTVMVWDEGTYVERTSHSSIDSEKAMLRGLEEGHMTFLLTGHKLNGEFALIKLKKSSDPKAWLLVKKRDSFASYKQNQSISSLSVKTGRSIEEIAHEAEEKGDVWISQKVNTQKTPASKKEHVHPPLPLPPPTKTGTSTLAPFPRNIKPMLATHGTEKNINKSWIFEKNFGGVRAIAEVEGQRVWLYSRSGLPFEKKFPHIVEALRALNIKSLFDGEIVGKGAMATYHVFDILYNESKDLRKEPLSIRKEILSNIKLKHPIEETPLIRVKTKRRENIVLKNPASIYRSGTTRDWIVLKDLSLEHVSARKIDRPSKKIAKPEPAFKLHRMTSPKVISPEAISNEEPRLTNLQKVFWPKEKITKGDVINYYRAIAPVLLPYLKDRPESLNRHPNGITSAGFYQKDMTGHIPRWLKTERIYSGSSQKSIDYVLCQDLRSLLYIINLGCIELNPWFSRTGSLDHPDFLVIDLDPDGNSFDHVIEVAHAFHEILQAIGVDSFCKTSGATGIHIGVPLGAKYDFDTARDFAEKVCRVVQRQFPSTTSMERNPNRRRRKIYLDYMQNRRGQTLAAPYCIRPREGATVSMPLKWTQLRKGITPRDFHIGNAHTFIGKDDPWKGVLGKGIDLEKCLSKLKKLNSSPPH